MRVRLLSAALATTALLILTGCAAPESSPPPAGSCDYVETGAGAREVTPPPAEPVVSGSVEARLVTSQGDIPITLDADTAPCTVESFVSLTDQGYFDGTECHRLTTSGIFVLQCGDPSGTGRGGPGYSYADELDGSETYPAGTVAMANAGADTNGSQFFLVYEDSPLPASYTVFGEMSADALATVRQIAAEGVAGGGGDGAPAVPVRIVGVSLG